MVAVVVEHAAAAVDAKITIFCFVAGQKDAATQRGNDFLYEQGIDR